MVRERRALLRLEAKMPLGPGTQVRKPCWEGEGEGGGQLRSMDGQRILGPERHQPGLTGFLRQLAAWDLSAIIVS